MHPGLAVPVMLLHHNRATLQQKPSPPLLDNLMMIFDEDGDEIRNASFCRHSANIIPFSTMASGIFSRTVLSLNVVHHRNKITNKMVSGVGGSTRHGRRSKMVEADNEVVVLLFCTPQQTRQLLLVREKAKNNALFLTLAQQMQRGEQPPGLLVRSSVIHYSTLSRTQERMGSFQLNDSHRTRVHR